MTVWLDDNLILESNYTNNTWRMKQNGHHFAEDIFKFVFVYENGYILIQISLEFVPKIPINNDPALIRITA